MIRLTRGGDRAPTPPSGPYNTSELRTSADMTRRTAGWLAIVVPRRRDPPTNRDHSSTTVWTQYTVVAVDRFEAGVSAERASNYNVPDGRFEANGVVGTYAHLGARQSAGQAMEESFAVGTTPLALRVARK